MENKSNDMFKMDIWHKGEKINAECIYDNEQLMAWVDNDFKSVFQCTHCNELHTEDDFYPNKYMKSGHSSWCKKCISIKGKEQRAAKKNTPVEEESEIPVVEETPETSIEDIFDNFKEQVKNLLSSKSVSESAITRLSDRIYELESENRALRESNEKLRKEAVMKPTVDKLDKRTVEEWVEKYGLDNRVLFRNIKLNNPKFDILITDTETGMTTTYRYDAA